MKKPDDLQKWLNTFYITSTGILNAQLSPQHFTEFNRLVTALQPFGTNSALCKSLIDEWALKYYSQTPNQPCSVAIQDRFFHAFTSTIKPQQVVLQKTGVQFPPIAVLQTINPKALAFYQSNTPLLPDVLPDLPNLRQVVIKECPHLLTLPRSWAESPTLKEVQIDLACTKLFKEKSFISTLWHSFLQTQPIKPNSEINRNTLWQRFCQEHGMDIFKDTALITAFVQKNIGIAFDASDEQVRSL